MERILIVGPSWIGDMIMAQSLFKNLKKVYPISKIDVLSPSWSKPVLYKMPEVSKVIEMPIGHGKLDLVSRYKIGKSLRGIYDIAYILPNSFKSALIPFFAQIKKRVGWRGEMRYWLLNDLRVLNKKQYPLMVERYTALAYPKNTKLNDKIAYPNLSSGSKEEKILAICPGAKYGKTKRWPEEYFAEVAKYKIAKGWRVYILGSQDEKAIGERISALAPGCIDYCGVISLEESIDLMASCKIVISNDSGLMHIAAALNKCLIAIYGSSSPDFTPPLIDNHRVKIIRSDLPCSPCFAKTCKFDTYECLQKISPSLIIRNMEFLENENINSKNVIHG